MLKFNSLSIFLVDLESKNYYFFLVHNSLQLIFYILLQILHKQYSSDYQYIILYVVLRRLY